MKTAHRMHTPECDKQTDDMTSIMFLLFLLLHQVYGEEAEPVFQAEGSTIEMGFCFGVDYVALYRCAPEGDQLLGNSSADSPAIAPPADLQGRIHVNKHQHLPGLRISQLTHMDSGIYRRECWKNQTLVSQQAHQLSVCDVEVESQEIAVEEKDGGAELLCNSTYISLTGTSVRWYHEKYPSYKLTLFLDSSVSLDPMLEEGGVEVRDSGKLLVLDKSVLKNNHHFYCLVIKGKTCLSFQNMHLPERSERREMFVSLADTVVLNCSSDGNNQQWETPLGHINASSVRNNDMYISFGDKSEDFSLVILAISDEHSGDYSCISPSLEVQYSLVLCSRSKSLEKTVFEGESISLDCDVGENDSLWVQWHRRKPSGEHELIGDSSNVTVPIPEDLSGRVTMSEKGSSLVISHVKMGDRAVYWCVILGGPELPDDDYIYDYYEEATEVDEFSGYQYWHETHRCIFKQETILSLNGRIFKAPTTNTETLPTPELQKAANVTPYAVGAGLVGLLVAGVVAAVIVIKRRTKASRKQDIKMNVDPGCTRRLTHSDEDGA